MKKNPLFNYVYRYLAIYTTATSQYINKSNKKYYYLYNFKET